LERIGAQKRWLALLSGVRIGYKQILESNHVIAPPAEYCAARRSFHRTALLAEPALAAKYQRILPPSISTKILAIVFCATSGRRSNMNVM
jgi:hypothetical protein